MMMIIIIIIIKIIKIGVKMVRIIVIKLTIVKIIVIITITIEKKINKENHSNKDKNLKKYVTKVLKTHSTSNFMIVISNVIHGLSKQIHQR